MVIAQDDKISLFNRSHDASGNPSAEEEYRQAIAVRKGIYPEAWRELSAYLSQRLRYDEAAAALKTSLAQNRRIFPADEKALTTLRRAAELQKRFSSDEILSSDEMVDFVNLIDQSGRTGDAIP